MEFATDLNGKQHEWEAMVLVPFIDEVGRREGEGGKQEWEAVVLIPFIDEVGRREGEGGEAGMGGCGVDPLH